MYRGAHGNGRAGLVKRFWTDCLYSSLPTEDEQAGWMKEEPPSIYGRGCQTCRAVTIVALLLDIAYLSTGGTLSKENQ